MLFAQTDSRFNRKSKGFTAVTLVVFTAIVIIGLMLHLKLWRTGSRVVHAAPAVCGNGLSGNMTQDTTWSGDIYLDGDITVEGSTTLTITPGTRVLFCGDYRLKIGDLFAPGRLVAEGTAAQPITFTIASGAATSQWNRLMFSDHLDEGPSVIKHATFENGGGADPASGYTIQVGSRATLNSYVTPLFQHVTVSASHGSAFEVNTNSDDPSPPELRDIVVENSARYPIEINAAGVSGLFNIRGSGNMTDTIRVRGDAMTQNQRWRKHAFPYEVGGDVNISGNNNATWTIDPGVELRMHPDAGIAIGQLYEPTRLIAKGTLTQPISVTAATDQNWGQLYFGDHLDQGASILQHVLFENGGGSDATQGQTINVSDRALVPAYHTPLLDHVIVRGSNGHGITVDATGSDPYPTQLTYVTVEDSSLHPVNVNVNAVGGIGQGFMASGNMTDTIRVFQDEMNFDSRWRNHGMPYEVVGEGFSIRSNYQDDEVVPAVWTIDPGVTVLMHPGAGVTVGSLYGEAQVMAKGNVVSSITFTRLSETSEPWGGFSIGAYSDLNSEFEHVNFSYGGGVSGTRKAVFTKQGSSQLILTNVSIQHSQNGAVWNFGGSTWIKDSVITYNRYGIDVQARTRVRVRGSDLRNNDEFALRNGSPDHICIDAVGNDWGPGGPSDTSADEDACGSTRTNDGTATVSDGVAYTPWQTAGTGGSGEISPEHFWVIANGQASTEIKVKLRDAQGQPLAGKQVSLTTNLGVLQQPTSPTDENGETKGVISSTETGFATITAINTTDGEPVLGTAGVNFWQGSGNFGGLVDPDGTPYASPAFELEGKPFQVGFPVEMRMPMQNTRVQNTRASSVDVEVIYGATGLSIGTRFTPIFTATRTLQPGETWNARGVWIPEVTGHHCIQARLSYNDGQQRAVFETGGGTRQINTDENPCSGLPSGPGDFSPSPDDVEGGSEDLNTAAEHFKNQGQNMGDAVECIGKEVSFRRGHTGIQQSRDYEVIVGVPEYTPPTIQAGPNLPQERSDVLNALSQTAAQALGLSRAIAATRQRMHWAAQADELDDVDRQYTAFLDFVRRYAQTLRTWAGQNDDFLAVTEGAGLADVYFYPEDYEAALNELKQTGFGTDTLDYLQQSGLSQELIEELRQDIVDKAQGQTFQTTSFYQTVRSARDEARQIAERLERRYGLNAQRAMAAATISGELQPYDFTVGHQFEVTKTINLQIRTVSLPMDWSARLDRENVTLGPDKTITNTLNLIPGERVPEASTVKVAVEGYVDGEYIGGILFSYNAPVVSGPRQEAGLALSAGTSQTMTVGGTFTFTHVVTNTGTATDTIILKASNTEDWPWGLIHSMSYPEGTAVLPLSLGSEMTTTVALTLTAPTDTISGTVNTAMITATSTLDPAVVVTATSTIEVWQEGFTIYLPLVLKNKS
jgi:hypothetical protein